ncbi:riboflavin synthase alpha chain [Salsuginibacillus halophilus]|uniref:Riboflavin synthase n=1 Tax=Salsuginibacillus halophilus TaxID=517424 RepID=A0A2P8HW46_9BACI|nr:riboflavin synthase [Salsuginibacillus halophilus]PSL50395.1 riboflavin synthase alpha chain [Salsuginibacillus halophilus]
MFTGIIEEKGKVQSLNRQGESFVLVIEAEKILQDVHLGDSIAVNGVCLTVTSFQSHSFTVDVMPETVRATSLRQLATGSAVNLERAMPANGRFGGHFVSGHVDGTGVIQKRTPEANAVYFHIQVDKELTPYISYKGSVAVDGISLTIFGIENDELVLSIIPHTLEETVLGEKGTKDVVNIETDMLAKYVERLLEVKETQTKPGLTKEDLNGYGFL